MGDTFSTQDCDWKLPRMAEEKLRQMPIAIEGEPRPRQPAVPHSPQHCQAAQRVEPITVINDRSSAWLGFLTEELKVSQCPLSPPSLVLSLAPPCSPPSLFPVQPQAPPPPPPQCPLSLLLNYLEVRPPLLSPPPLLSSYPPPPLILVSPSLSPVSAVLQRAWLLL